MQVKYLNEIPKAEDFYKLYESTGWNSKHPKTPKSLYEALKNS